MILRCTARFLNLLGVRPKDLAVVEPSRADWYANLLWLDRRKCLLLAHADTLFGILVADVRKADLVPLAPFVLGVIERELRAESLPSDAFGNPDSASVQLAKTNSRTVLGYMNELARFCGYFVEDSGGLGASDIDRLNWELRRLLHLSRQPPGHFIPIDLARALTA